MSSSPALSSPASGHTSSPTILTPSRRVKELLAQFDDSDSDDEITASPRNAPIEPSRSQEATTSSAVGAQPALQNSDSESEEDADILPTVPRGRLAARMQAQHAVHDGSDLDDKTPGNAYQRLKEQIREVGEKSLDKAETIGTTAQSSSEDELAGSGRRRLLLKRKSSPAMAPQYDTPSRSRSPLFFPSHSARRRPSGSQQSGAHSEKFDTAAHLPTSSSSRFQELVEKHRKQRLAKEAADVVKRADRVEQLQNLSKNHGRQRGSSPADDSDEDSDASNRNVSAKLSKQTRPSRKASKKAIEEMNRETQRMTRNMQLAHQAKTKKKITKESLLATFNFQLPGQKATGIAEEHNKSATASSAPVSETEGASKHSTPPTSPLLPSDSMEKEMSTFNLPPAEIIESAEQAEQDEEELPSMEDIMTQSVPTGDKGKSKAIASETLESTKPTAATKAQKVLRPIRVKWSQEDAVIARAADSDSDLEIVTSRSKARKIAAFESLTGRKASEKHSHLILRSLAHIETTSDKKRPSINTAQLEAGLRKAARMQARKERQDKIEELKAKGVVIQSTEERERDQQEVEDLVERARQEGTEIQRREQAKAKKDGTFVKDGLDDDGSDDEYDGDFQDEDEVVGNDASAEEVDEEEDDEDDEGDNDVEDDLEEEAEEEDAEEAGMDLSNNAGLIDQEADEQGSGESEEDEQEVLSDDEDEWVQMEKLPRKSRTSRVLSDDEDDGMATEDGDAVSSLPVPAKPPQSVPRSARKIIPGLQMSDDLPMGLTQAFAATMAESQTQDEDPQTQEQDSLDFTRELPSPGFSLVPKLHRLESLDIVTDSQPASQTQALDLDLSFSQSQQAMQSQGGVVSTQFSETPFELTQDVGFVLSPFAEKRFDTPHRNDAPQSTIETVILHKSDQDSPILQRKGRLRRGRAATMSDEETAKGEKDNSVFDVMRRAAAHKAVEPLFDKSKSYAKDIVDEAAEESEDEYAGLGGASDDEAGEEDEEDRRMIDHDEKVGHGDEAKLAGLFADKERKQEEAAVSKLLKDITTGALRRKRGVGDELDLSDEEDEAARRREAKRREFARMRRELLKDEAVGKIAEDKKKEAFLKSIEDREAAEDEESLDFDEAETQEDESQSQQAAQNESTKAPNAESSVLEVNNNKRKRPLEPSAADTMNRLPPALRRTTGKASTVNRKPSTLAEIRESVSFLIEEPDSQSTTPQYASSDEEDQDPEAYVDLDRHLQAADDDAENDDGEDLGDFIVDDSQEEQVFKKPQLPPSRAPFAERRTKINVVDRRSLLRQSSSSSSSSISATSKMAFFTSKGSGLTDAFASKAPLLLRRATTNSSFGSSNMSATGVTVMTERGAPGQEKEVIRKGASGRRNAVNYRVKPKEEQMKSRVAAKKAKKTKAGSGFLGGLFRGDSWN